MEVLNSVVSFGPIDFGHVVVLTMYFAAIYCAHLGYKEYKQKHLSPC